jgi:hypothetical protein
MKREEILNVYVRVALKRSFTLAHVIGAIRRRKRMLVKKKEGRFVFYSHTHTKERERYEKNGNEIVA